jgi:hypothetical protein
MICEATYGTATSEVPMPAESPTPIVPDAPSTPMTPDPGTPIEPGAPSTVPGPAEPAEPVAPSEPSPTVPLNRRAVPGARHRRVYRPAAVRSRSSSQLRRCNPPTNVSGIELPRLTRWQGTNIGIGLAPNAYPSRWASVPGAIRW